ncbi:hypothetical protein CFP65_0615 [Kitasatospora sp. MMS16-BH015]|uniref:penicillin-binding transpeptidase domain-containing protein n=1 Tax=Kitasatospora sp. MMS16-BH015 TaxID=2018025 RepID=UPI000CA2B38E|nr:penicillin-binding transpeptidase domain-containing protein [Kitasatospora sp. MMS16-BH015]AUG75572.1 hypothetical protein CFP65_0615 [Kitasatospora sp. MMS16-BH015]
MSEYEYEDVVEPEHEDVIGSTDADAVEPEPEPGSRKRRVIGIGIAVVTASLLAVGGCGAYNLTHAIMNGSKGGTPTADGRAAAPQPAGPPPSTKQATNAAAGFLAAWSRGDLTAAAVLTDDPISTSAALTVFRQGAAPKQLTLTPTGPGPAGAAGTVTMGFHARLAFDGTDRALEYDSALGLVRTADGRTVVHWTPKVIHPDLVPNGMLTVRPTPIPAGHLVDRDGAPLTGSAVTALLADLKDGRPVSDGTPGRAVVLIRPGLPDKQLLVLGEGSAAQRKVTLDADLQQTAEAALAEQTSGGRAGSLVAIEPSTGRILAAASTPAGFNRAFGGTLMPGSTLKTVTAAALLESGLGPDSPAPCKATTTSPRTWRNDEPGDHLGYTLADSFAHSCNTAFIDQGLARLAPGDLGKVAVEQFGLGLVWHTGLSSFDAKIPVPASRDDQAAELIGHGGVQVNTLAMASVAATVQNGTFRQPYLVDGTERAAATGRLPAAVARDLRAMMAKAATDGTARAPMAGLTGQIGAKTGTADEDGQADPDSWFIAYRGDLAVAVEIHAGGHGADAAGQVAARVLKAGNEG